MQSELFQQVLARGEAEYFPPQLHTLGMPSALAAFNLKPDPTSLRNVSYDEAVEVLSCLLNRGMAYGEERLPLLTAQELAKELLSPHERCASLYFSNGNFARQEGWNPMTESTFDSGLIIQSPGNEFTCIWFRDED